MTASFDYFKLTTPLRNAIDDLGFLQTTPIQKECFSPILSGKDVIGIAQTGTGKTFAYLLPLLKKLKYSEQKHPRILILVPTRELVLQVVNEIKKLTTYINVRFEGVFGGANIKTQGQRIYNGIDIIVGTPGRLIDLTLSGILRLKTIQNVVIDEVDEMLNLGFKHQLIQVLELLPQKKQTLMFSATLSEEVEKLIHQFFYEPLKIQTTEQGNPIETIEQSIYKVPNFNTKINLLALLLSEKKENEKFLVFVSSKKNADILQQQINKKGNQEIGIIHSNKAQNTRFNAIKNFNIGETKILIATDIAARGLDFDDVSHVVNFDMPETAGDYIHRIGRTGRAEKQGIALSFVSEQEEETLQKIENFMKINILEQSLPKTLVISEVLTEEEKNKLYDKDYLIPHSLKNSKGAFHQKKGKNNKTNSGSPSRKKKKR